MGVKKVFHSSQCTAYFLPRFISKLLISCFSCNLCFILQAHLFCLYNNCRRSRALCMSKTRWVKWEPCPMALLCEIISTIKASSYLLIEPWGKANSMVFNYVMEKLGCTLVTFPESHFLLIAHGEFSLLSQTSVILSESYGIQLWTCGLTKIAQKWLNTWRNAVSCWIYTGLLHKQNIHTAGGEVWKQHPQVKKFPQVVVVLIISKPRSVEGKLWNRKTSWFPFVITCPGLCHVFLRGRGWRKKLYQMAQHLFRIKSKPGMS